MKYLIDTKIRKMNDHKMFKSIPTGTTGTVVADPDAGKHIAVMWDGPEGPIGFSTNGPYGFVSGPYLYTEEELDKSVEIIQE